MKKICVVTGTRAEYGLLKNLMKLIKDSNQFALQILVTGAHLSPEFGLTVHHIISDNFTIDEQVEALLSADTASSIIKSMGVGMIGYADALARLKPDLLVILGDRYEMLAVASSAMIFNIPIAHIHGGEITEGAYDDAIRHSITKMSHLHFASTESYRKRIIQMGEQPSSVFNVGAVGLDNIVSLPLMSKEAIEEDLKIKFNDYNYQVTFHPSTLDQESPDTQFQILLDVIKEQEHSFFIFTKANADTGGRIINKMIDEFATSYPSKCYVATSLGNLRFLSVLKCCNAIVGNSSSGIIEAPAIPVATINIGNRQKGRMQAPSVVNCDINKDEILNAFQKIKSPDFLQLVNKSLNPYGNGGASQKIYDIISKVQSFRGLIEKKFYDLPNSN